jgi:hypothetical protein
VVSLYEENQARRKGGYKFKEWYNLLPEERAIEVAILRIDSSIEYQKYLKEKRAIERK